MVKQAKQGTSWFSLFIIGFISTVCWLLGPPEGLNLSAWHSAILFIATITAIVTKVLPLGAIGFIALTLFSLTNAAGDCSSAAAMKRVLSEFNNALIWLVLAAFMIARGFIKTGLGRRIALILVRLMGKQTLGMAYGLTIADLILSPAMPSVTARCGGVLYPIANALAHNFDSYPEDASRNKIGTFLITCIGNVNDITSTLFMTAYVGNLLTVKLAGDMGVHLSWGGWFIAMLMPCLISLMVVPLVVYWLTNPEIKQTPNAPSIAQTELAKMGRLSGNEWIMLATFALLLVLWAFGNKLNVDATQASFIGLSVLLLSGVLSWEDVKSEKGAWDTLIWFSALLMMANMLEKLGFTVWFGHHVGNIIGFWMAGSNWILTLLALNIVYFYIHYFFASGTAQIAALYAVFLAIGIHLGIPTLPMVLMLAATSSLFCSLTQYASVRGAILFGSGFVPTGVWWRTGFIVSLVNQVIFMTIGLLWWKVLGFY